MRRAVCFSLDRPKWGRPQRGVRNDDSRLHVLSGSGEICPSDGLPISQTARRTGNTHTGMNSTQSAPDPKLLYIRETGREGGGEGERERERERERGGKRERERERGRERETVCSDGGPMTLLTPASDPQVRVVCVRARVCPRGQSYGSRKHSAIKRLCSSL